MKISYPIGSNIKALRHQQGINQEVLARALDVTVQAVSKWETGSSLPDILLLPRIAQFFHVTLDFLFISEENGQELGASLPDDGKLRLVQFLGQTMLDREQVDFNKPIPLRVDHLPEGQLWNVEIWGSADIKGGIAGSVNAGTGVNCGNVGGNVDAGCGVNCGNVEGNVDAGSGINCGNVRGNVDAGSGINCDNVGGNVDAGSSIHCTDICHADRVSCHTLVCKEGHIHCNTIDFEEWMKEEFR